MAHKLTGSRREYSDRASGGELEMIRVQKYVLLTEFEVCTVSYGPCFFPFDLWPKQQVGQSEKRAGYKSKGKKRIRNL